ncbi:MAG TPA: hypothetical protein VGI45_05385 [Terracidiphilus sp.]|jgi:hypothetical protein
MAGTITLADLDALVQKFAAQVRELPLTDDEKQEYGTILNWLRNEVKTGEPSEWIVEECMKYFNVMTSRRV